MPRAVCLIRDREPYPHPQFAAGLRACGFKVSSDCGYAPSPSDVLLIWNRNGSRHGEAQRFEQTGASVIVAENGWIGRASDGGKFYALCLGHHNGMGRWPDAQVDRWPLFHVKLKPWRVGGREIVVLASRGIGEPGIAEPRGWSDDIAKALRKRTGRPVRVRKHPGDSHALVEDDLADAHCAVTWASGAGIKALAHGVPVFHGLKGWIGAAAAKHGIEEIEAPFLGDRMPMFRRLASAQWTAAEIATGDPIKCLLSMSPSTA